MAAVARFRDSARPRIGILTIWSANSRSFSGKPQASLPKSHAVGILSDIFGNSISLWPSAAKICRPFSRQMFIASLNDCSLNTGRWNNDPAVERTTFGLVTSTLSPVNMTQSAPKASATLITVPAFPGSRTLLRMAISFGLAPKLVQSLNLLFGISATARISWALVEIFCNTSEVA